MNRNLWLIAITILIVLVTLIVFPIFFAPESLANGVTLTAEITERVTTSEQLQQGIPLRIPNLGTQPATILVYTESPFSTVPSFRVGVPPGQAFSTLLRTTTNAVIDPATYTAAVASVENAENTHSLILQVAAQPIFPLIAILAGLLLSHFVLRWQRIRRPGMLTSSAALRLLATYDNIPTRLAADLGLAAPPLWLNRFTMRDYFNRRIGYDVPRDPTSILALTQQGLNDQADAALTQLKTELDTYYTTLKHLAELNTVYETFKQTYPATPRPQLETTVAAFLQTDYPITGPHQLQTLAAQIKSYGDAYVELISASGRLLQCDELLAQLDPPDADRPALEHIRSRVDFIRADLNRFTTAAEFTNAKLRERIEDALQDLRALAAKYPTRRSTDRDTAATTTVPVQIPALAAWATELPRRLKETLDTMFRLPDTPAQRARRLEDNVWIADLLLLTFGWLVAVVTAMTTLYVGKPFGAPADYLAAFLWGSGVDQALRGLYAVLLSFGINDLFPSEP